MSTQRVDRKEFRRVRAEGAPKEKGQGPENLIRVTAQRGQRSYISYAIALLNGEEGKAKQDTIKVSGMGAAIFNAVNIAEIVKRRVKGLHQITEISSETVKDSYEGIESKKTMDVERKVATVLITLSTKALDKKNIGYQAPLPEDQVTEQEERAPAERRERRTGGRGSGRGSARGGRGSARGSGRGGRTSEKKDGDKKKDGEKKAATTTTTSRGGRGSARGTGGRGSGRGGAAPAEKKADKPKETKPKTAKPDYDKLGADAEDKLDRQKGDGHNKAKPSGQAKPKSVRASK